MNDYKGYAIRKTGLESAEDFLPKIEWPEEIRDPIPQLKDSSGDWKPNGRNSRRRPARRKSADKENRPRRRSETRHRGHDLGINIDQIIANKSKGRLGRWEKEQIALLNEYEKKQTHSLSDPAPSQPTTHVYPLHSDILFEDTEGFSAPAHCQDPHLPPLSSEVGERLDQLETDQATMEVAQILTSIHKI